MLCNPVVFTSLTMFKYTYVHISGYDRFLTARNIKHDCYASKLLILIFGAVENRTKVTGDNQNYIITCYSRM